MLRSSSPEKALVRLAMAAVGSLGGRGRVGFEGTGPSPGKIARDTGGGSKKKSTGSMPGAEASGRMQRLGPQHVAAASWSPGASPTYAPGPIVLPVTPRQARRAQPSQSPRPAGSGGTPGRGGKRGNATATDAPVHVVRTLAPGVLAEVVRRRVRLLVRIDSQDVARGSWNAHDASGRPMTVEAREVSFVLPGRGHPPEAAAEVAAEVDDRDPADLERAWERCLALAAERGEDPAAVTTSADEAARAMYGRADPASVYRAHLLLSDDRTFFASASASPARYRPRPREHVESILAYYDPDRVPGGREVSGFVTLAATLLRGPAAGVTPSYPALESWSTGPWANVAAAVEALALATATPEQQAIALRVLSRLGMEPAPNGAAALLEGIGMWRRNEDVFAKRVGASPVFPAGVQADADRIVAQAAAGELVDPDRALRRDLRFLHAVTIDSIDTVEVDDAVSVERLPDGRTRVWVHIADPSHLVALGSPLDLEARRRASTLYQPTEVIPMFPMALASGPMSLVAHRDSCAFSLTAILAEDGSVEEFEICPSLVHITRRMTYEDVDAVLESAEGAEGGAGVGAGAGEEAAKAPRASVEVAGAPAAHHGAAGGRAGSAASTEGESTPEVGSYDGGGPGERGSDAETESGGEEELAWQLRELLRLSRRRRQFRESQGALNFERTEARVRVGRAHTADPDIRVDTKASGSPSVLLVTEMMVLGGEIAALFGRLHGVPLPFRGHPPSPPPSEAAAPSRELQAEQMLGTMARSLMCAGQRVPHSALGLEGYVQVTSPIRRYLDLLAHHQIKAVLRGQAPPLAHPEMHAIVDQCTRTATAIKAAQRDAERAWLARYIMQRPHRRYRARVLSWMRQDLGLARVVLEDLALETLAHVQVADPGDDIDVVCTFADPFNAIVRVEQTQTRADVAAGGAQP